MIDQTELKEVVILMVAGFFGSLVRLVRSPGRCWRQWVVRFTVGISCAVFLGGIMGQLISKWLGSAASETSAASGFIVGICADQVIALIQRRMERIDSAK